MRLNLDIFSALNPEIIEQCAKTGRKSQILSNLVKIIKQ